MLSSHVVENAVKDYLYAVFVESLADLCEILVGAQTCIYLGVVGGIIAMSRRLENRAEINGIYAHCLKVGYPLYYLLYPVYLARELVTGALAAAEAQRVDVINSRLFDPFGRI